MIGQPSTFPRDFGSNSSGTPAAAPYEDYVPMVKAAIIDSGNGDGNSNSINPIQAPASVLRRNYTPLSERQMQELQSQGYTRSLAESLNRTKKEFALRIWVVDNSGSMQATDGHRFVAKGSGGNLKVLDCTRWEEIRDCVEYHIRLASLIDAPTRFRFLNPPGAMVGPSQFSIAEDGNSRPEDEVREAIHLIRHVSPGGCTPLTQHILEIHREIQAMAPYLRSKGQRVSITIATDGLPTDERGYGGVDFQNELVEALRRLEGLPVWVVIRLCTDDGDCVEFYNNLDNLLELSIDVLDDFFAEAKEVYDGNPFLNYTLPLHRLREFGYHDRLFDLIDERKLTASELHSLCLLLFGTDYLDGAPDPSSDWKGFTKVLKRALRTTGMQWNPIRHKIKPLVSIKKLNRDYGGSSCM